jgi:secreted trypsin-like serine protease
MGKKRNVVLYLDRDLVAKSKSLGFNLSKTFENHLKQLITQFSTFNSANNSISTSARVTNPGLPGWITCDVGIVVLSEPVPTSLVDEYGVLPTVGEVNTLHVKDYVDLVGYGVQYQVTPRNDGGPYGAWRGTKTRYFVQAQLLSKKFAISESFLMTSANLAKGKGGTTFGDSGGPVFKEGTSTILALTSFGADANCASPGYYYRVDQADVLSFINGFLI